MRPTTLPSSVPEQPPVEFEDSTNRKISGPDVRSPIEAEETVRGERLPTGIPSTIGPVASEFSPARSESPLLPSERLVDPEVDDSDAAIQWWTSRVADQVLDRQRWVTFDLETLLLDTLANSPRVLSVGYSSSATYQRIIVQDAAFDSTMLLSSDLGATNDPVGNSLITGGADRLREQTLAFRGGVRRTTRRGTELEWTQELGFQDSNSDFFIPEDQANSRLSLSINKPLLSRGGRYYNERLITQARFDDRVAWQQLRGEVEERIAEVIIAYWQLYRIRAQLTQQKELLRRSLEIERLLISRRDFDAARIEISKANQRVARRSDQLIELEATLKDQQVRLANLVGSDSLAAAGIDLELIPTGLPQFSNQSLSQRDALAEALKFRPEIRLATANVASSALEMKITRTELEPQLNWIFDAYLSQLNGSSQAFRSFGEQFVNAPSVSTALEFELPKGRRAAKASYREAVYRARQRSELLREAIQQTQLEVQTALIEVDRFAKQLVSKRRVLETAIVEENILTTQWRIIGGDDSRVGIKLENLLDAQQRRTDAEKDLVTVETGYMIALVRLQRAMGTLLIREGLPPHRSLCSGDVQFLRDSTDSSLDVSHTCGELTDSQDVEVDQQGQSFLPERPRELGEPVSSDSIDSETLELPPPVSE